MTSETIRASTFDDRFADVARVHVNTVSDLKEHLEAAFFCPSAAMKILYGGRELCDEYHLDLIDRVYVCLVPQKCGHTRE